jgi:hypothetical protein
MEVLKFTLSYYFQFKMASNYNQSYRNNGSSSSGLFVLFFILLVAIGAFATNPSAAEHKLILKDKMRELLNTEMDKLKSENDNEFSQLGVTFGAALGGMIVDKFIDQNVRVDDYYLFSITNVYYEGKKNPVGMGIFGKVILHPDIDKVVKNGLPQN